jgi:hypothetical protein
MYKQTFLFLIAATLAGCATIEVGQKFNTAAESRLQIGVTTIQDAKSWFGQPVEVRHHSNGDTGLIYGHRVAHGNGLTGHATAQAEVLAMEFGPDGKLTRFDTGGAPASSKQN